MFYQLLSEIIIIIYTRVVSHLARSDTPNIYWVVSRVASSDTPSWDTIGEKTNPPPQPPLAASIHCMHIHIFNKLAVS